MRRAPRIMLCAGEPSGDRLGAGLSSALRRRLPDIELFGMGGERMEEAGVRLVQDASAVAVVGIVEVLSRLPAIRRARRRLRSVLEERRPDLLVPIDFPEFNLLLAGDAQRAGVPVVYFVSPQIWAWRRGRLRKIRRLIRRMLVLFPFEVGFYERAGVPVSFVGHPMAERSETVPARSELLGRAGLREDRRVVALLPGSRRSEVERILPALIRAGERLHAERSDLQFLICVAPGLERERFDEILSEGSLPTARLHAGDYPEILAACDAGAVAAGTASLEAAVMGLPIVVVYRMNPLSYHLGRRLVRLEHVALPNLIAGRTVVPELIQGDCTPEAIAAALDGYLNREDAARTTRESLKGIRDRLGGPGVFERAAEQVLAELSPA